MKKVAIFAFSALFAIGISSCSKDFDNGTDASANGGGAFQFSLQTAKGALITYADIATDAEWNYGDVSVFIYEKTADGSGTLLGDNDDFAITSGTGKTTLTATDAWTTANKGKTINVYFVGNNAAANLFVETAQATGLATEALFIEQLTEAQKVTDGFAELLKTPLLFSASALDVLVPSANKVTVPVTLKRREARFDIVNPVPTDFVISKVVVRNANLQGFIFADATTTPTLATGKLKEIDCTGITYDSDDLAASVFYLYPTTLGVGAGTEIAVIATMLGGDETSYPVNSSAKIEANKRYKLVFDKAQLVFNVVPADYDEGEELAAAPMTELDFSDFTVASGTATYDHINGLVYVIPNDPASMVSFTTYASTAAGVEITMTPFLGTGPAITMTTNTTEPTVTYSNIGFKTTVAIEIDKYTGSESFQTVVKVKDKGSDAYNTFLVLYDDGQLTYTDGGNEAYLFPHKAGSLPAVKVGDLWWAPVNVGATTDRGAGLFFQWGRNIAFKSKNTKVVPGPVAITDEQVSSSSFISPNTLISTAWMTNTNETDTWTTIAATTPCPKGWRLPSLNDAAIIMPMGSPSGRFNSQTLYTPNSGGVMEADYLQYTIETGPAYYIGLGETPDNEGVIYRYGVKKYQTPDAWLIRYKIYSDRVEITYIKSDELFVPDKNVFHNTTLWNLGATVIFPSTGEIDYKVGEYRFPEYGRYWLASSFNNTYGAGIFWDTEKIFAQGKSKAAAQAIRCVKDVQ